MAELLSEVEYGRILGSFTAVAEDFGDTVAPDAIPLTGTVTFYPSQSHVSYINLAGETASLYIPPISASIVNGRIIGSDGKDGVVLLASNSNNVSASVLWTARISINPINSGDPAPADHDFLIEVRRGEIASLIDVIKATSRVHNIALFHDAIAEAAAAFWERVESGEFRGNQGPPGPAGVGVGVPGPSGRPGIMGKDGDPGVGGNLTPDGDLEEPGFLVSGDYQESSDAVSGSKAVRLSNATSRRIRLEPDTSYVGTVYLKSAEATTVNISQRVFGSEGDIDRVIEDSYQLPADTWKRVTFLLDSNVGDQSMEIVVTTDGRTISADLFALSDNSVVKGLQRDLTAAKVQLEAAMAQLDLDLAEVDADKEMLAVSLNDLAVVLEDADIDLTALNAEMDDLKNDLIAEETKRQDADAAAQVILEQLDTNLSEAKQELVDNKLILETLDTDLATAKAELLESAQSITRLETETLPELQRTLEAANTAAIQELSALDDKLYGAEGDITTAKESIAQLSADLTTEAQTRAQLAIDLQADFEERDTRLAEAEGILSAAFPDGAVNVPEELSRTIRDSVVQYAVSNSAETPPTTGWSPASPNKDPGQYIWFRTLITYGDNSTRPSSAALLTGNTGPGGPQGPAGADGTDGTGVTILGSRDSEAQLPTTGNDGDAYLVGGYLYVWSSGSWSNVGLIRGPQGVPGPAGEDGEPRFTWVKYASSATGTGISDDPAGKSYIGLAYNKTTAVESSTPGDYQWALIQGPQGSPGIQGPAGEDGTSLYTWLKYASTPTTGMSDSPIGKDYIGLAYNKTTPTESDTYTDYQWTLIKGAKGDQGVPGDPGADGTPRYTWVKYATSGAGAGMSDDPTGKTYIGLAYNKTSATESAVASDYQWALIQGPRGEAGPQGVPGPEGADGESLYTWIKYATTPTTGMADLPAGKKYMGIAYNKPNATESSSYSDYEWSLIEGPQGNQGIQGPKGADGQPTYTWIKYGTSSTGTGMADTPAGKTYIGIAYNKTTATESNTASDYAWSLIQGPKGDTGSQGIPGPKGLDGPSLFTWLKYADTPTTGMSDLPAGKKYMGIAYNKTTATESSSYSDYEWSLIEGPQGNQGIQGPKGTDGQTTYTWIKYGTSSTGAGISDSPTGKTYIGIAYNKTTATESGTASDYEWSLIQGPKGTTGGTGPQGIGISSITPYYRDVVRGAAAPAVPTTATPTGWATSEPTWVPNRDLYRVEKITYTNSTFAYTAVTKIAAYAGIDAAMAAANGKNLNTYSDLAVASKPGPAPANNSARTVGDVHRNRNSSTGEVWAEYQWTGSAWKPVSFGDSVLTSLDVGKITGGTGAFQQFFADKLIADDATINTLWTDKLAAKTITAQQVTVAPGNSFPDPSGMVEGTRNSVGGSTWSWDVAGRYWKRSAVNGSTTQFNAFLNTTSGYDSGPLTPGETYRIAYDIWGNGTGSIGNGRAAIMYRKVDGSTTFVGDNAGDGDASDRSDPLAANQWHHVERTWIAPDDAVSGGFTFQLLSTSASATEIRIRNPFIGVKSGAISIKDGAISADKINAESVGAAVGKFINLETSQLVATDSIKTPEAVIDKLWAETMSTKKVYAENIVVATSNMLIDRSEFLDTTPNKAGTGSGLAVITSSVYGRHLYLHLAEQNQVDWATGIWFDSDDPDSVRHKVKPNTEYRFSFDTSLGGAGTGFPEVHAVVYEYGQDGVWRTSNRGEVAITGWDRKTYEVTFTTSSDTVYVRPCLEYRGGGGVGEGNLGRGGIRVYAPDMRPTVGSVIISDGAVNASKINAESVGAAVGEFVKLDVKDLTSSTANINSLVAQKIAAGTAAFQTVNADKIIASTASMDSAVINQIWADGIAAKSIISSQITVAAGNILVRGDGRMGRVDAATTFSYHTDDLPSGASTWGRWELPSTSSAGNDLFPAYDDEYAIRVDPDRTYTLTYWAKNSATKNLHYVRMNRQSPDGVYNNAYYVVSAVQVGTTWTKYQYSIEPAALAGYNRIGFTVWGNHPNAAETGVFTTAGWSLIPKVGAVLIENGAISANHMTANSIDTEHLRANAVSAEKIVSGAITTDKMTANSINGDRIAANTMQANKIVGKTITATQIKARAISAAEIATRTLLAENIVSGAITANEIKARTITAAEIAAGTITANELDVGNITANTGFIDNLWTNGISTKTINAATVHVGSADNLLPGTNTWSQGRLGGDLSPWSSFGINTGDPSVWLKGPSNGNVSYPVRFRKGVRYRFEVDVKSSVSGTKFFWEILTSTTSNTRAVSFSNPSGQSSAAYPFNSVTVVGTGWNSFWGEGVANEDADGYIRFYGNHSSGAANASGYQWFRNPRIQAMTGSTLIEGGAIKTEHITANSINGDRIQANSLSADKINGNTFTGNTFYGGTFSGAKFRTANSAPYAYMGDYVYTGTNNVSSHGFYVEGENKSRIRVHSGPATGGAGKITLSDTDDSTSIEIRGSAGVGDIGHGIKVFHKNGQDAINLHKQGQDNARAAIMLHRDDGVRSIEMWSADVYNHSTLMINDGAGITAHRFVGNGPFDIGQGALANTGPQGEGTMRQRVWLRAGDTNGPGVILFGNPNDASYGQARAIGDWRFNGNLQAAGAATTSATANTYMVIPSHSSLTERGRLYYSTSSRRYKRNIANWSPDVSRVLKMQPRQWQHNDPNSPIDEQWYVGFVAEEIDSLGLKGLVRYEVGKGGKLLADGLNYDRFAAAQQVVLRDHEDRIKTLEETVSELLSEIKNLRKIM